RSSNWRMGSSPASLDSWSDDGSMTNGVPKKSRTWGQPPGTLIGCLPGCRTDLACQRVRRVRGPKIPGPARRPSRAVPTGAFTLLVSPMSEVTRILSAIEQGDPHAAERLLPLVYDELRRLAVQKLAQEKPGQTLQATALVHEAYLRLVGAGHGEPW